MTSSDNKPSPESKAIRKLYKQFYKEQGRMSSLDLALYNHGYTDWEIVEMLPIPIRNRRYNRSEI